MGYHPDKEILVVAQVHIPFGVDDELRFTAALSHEKTESDQLPLRRSRPVRV